jgi:hypothetical protein
LPFFVHGDDSLTLTIFVTTKLESSTSGCFYVTDPLSAYIALRDREMSVYTHELQHFMDWLSDAINAEPVSEYSGYIAQYVTAVFTMMTEIKDQPNADDTAELIALERTLPSDVHAAHCGRQAISLVRGMKIYASPTCGKSVLNVHLIEEGWRVLDNDAIYWGVLTRCAVDASSHDEASSWLTRRNNALVDTVKRFALATSDWIAYDLLTTNVLPDAPCDVYVVRPAARTINLMIERAQRTGKKNSLISEQQVQATIDAARAAATKYDKPFIVLNDDEYLADVFNINIDDPNCSDDSVYRVARDLYFPHLNLISPWGKEVAKSLRPIAKRAHESVDVIQRVIPVIGLAGMGAESIVAANGSFPVLKGDNVGWRTDPLYNNEWNYDPYYIWCKMLQLSEDGKTRLVSFTGDYRVLSIALLPYPLVFILELDQEELLKRKNEWRKAHQLGELSLESISDDYQEYTRGVRKLLGYRDKVQVVNVSGDVRVIARDIVTKVKALH